MSLRRINESFKKLYESPENYAVADPSTDIKAALQQAADELVARGDSNIKSYEIAFQNVIENFYPDEPWYTVTDVDIFNHLFTERDPKATIEAIVAGIKPEESVDESVEPLQERIPKDLARAYDKSRVHSYATRNYDSMGKVDFENSEYTEITPEQALAMKKEGTLSTVKALVNGELVTFYNDGTQDNFIQYLPHNKKYTTRTGRDEYNSKYVPLKHILSVADKLYVADEKTVDPEKMKARLGVGEDGRFKSDEYDPSGRFGSQRDANLELGKHRRDGWGSYGDFEKKWHQRAKDKLADLEARWEAGDISRNEYEKYKAKYSDDIDEYESKRLKDIQFKRDRRADARNYASNIEATSAVRTFKQLKKDMKSTQGYIDRAAAKVVDLKANASNSSEYDYAKKELSKLKSQLWDIQHRIDYYEKRLADAENGAEVAKYEAEMQNYLNQLSDAQNSINALLRRDKKESLSESYYTVGYDSNGVNSVVMVKATSEQGARDTYMKLKGGKYPTINSVGEIDDAMADSYKKRGMSCLNETFTATPNKDAAYEIISELSEEGAFKMLEAFVRWMSDNDVGEFLHQEGYVEYEN